MRRAKEYADPGIPPPMYSPVRVLDAEGKLQRVISHAELLARPSTMPEGPQPVTYYFGATEKREYAEVPAVQRRRGHQKPVRRQKEPR